MWDHEPRCFSQNLVSSSISSPGKRPVSSVTTEAAQGTEGGKDSPQTQSSLSDVYMRGAASTQPTLGFVAKWLGFVFLRFRWLAPIG